MIAEATALVLALGLPTFGGPVYRPADRAVSNWRIEAARALEAAPERLARIIAHKDPGPLPRCVRLNNYWCIKSARWNGEIAADGEGHVAFSSAHEGAVVAAQLLRRYYVDLNRKTAASIVARWAPAECVLAARPTAGRRAASSRRAADGLTTRGLGNTLRARWLAANRGKARVAGKAAGKPAASRRVARAAPSRIAAAPRTQMMRAPSIAVGLGERPAASMQEITLKPVRVAALTVTDAAPPTASLVAPCAGETARMRAYAGKIADGVAAGPDVDLAIFDAAGRPTPALRQVMLNMAAVEIGPLRVDPSLVDAAIEAHKSAIAAREAEAKAAEPAP